MPDIIEQLIMHEGEKLKPYRDTVGKLTIGVGRNLDDVGISASECRYLLANDVAKVCAQLSNRLPWWKTLSPVRQKVLIDMAFNMGVDGLLTFKNTLAAIEAGDFARASAGMLASKWAEQVKGRAQRLARMMLTGADYGL